MLSLNNFHLILLGCMVLLFSVSNIVSYLESDFCEVHEARLQLVFVVDSTGTFERFKKKFATAAKQLFQDLKQEYPGSEFAVVTFSDYHRSALPVDGQPGDLEGRAAVLREGCYTREIKFTTDEDLLKSAIAGINKTFGGTNYHESSLTALSFATVDREMGWVNKSMTEGVYTYKFLVLATDEPATRMLKNQTGRHPPKLDGTDKCFDTLPPNTKQIGNVFMENNIAVIGLYVKKGPDIKNRTVDVFKYYREFFHKIPKVRYTDYELETNNVDKIIKDIKDGIAKERECLQADPPAYNTLGY